MFLSSYGRFFLLFCFNICGRIKAFSSARACWFPTTTWSYWTYWSTWRWASYSSKGIKIIFRGIFQKIKIFVWVFSIPILAFDEAVPLEYIGGRFRSLDGSLDELGVKFVRFLEIRRLLSRDESRDLLMFWAADLPRLVEYPPPPTPTVRLYVDNSVFNALTRISRLENTFLRVARWRK